MMSVDGPDDDWGCVDADELFVSSGPTPSLLSLVARVEHRNRMHSISKFGVELRKITGKMEDLCTDGGALATDWERTMSGGRLNGEEKQLNGGAKMGKRGVNNLKQLAFEVEKFVATNLSDPNERQSAEQRMVIALGAKPPRRKAINYRTLKEQRMEAKQKIIEGGGQQQQRDGLKSVRKGKVRKKEAGRKRKNGSGVLKKRNRERRKMGGRKKGRK